MWWKGGGGGGGGPGGGGGESRPPPPPPPPTENSWRIHLFNYWRTIQEIYLCSVLSKMMFPCIWREVISNHPRLITMQRENNHIETKSHCESQTFENLNCKLQIRWKICRVAFFSWSFAIHVKPHFKQKYIFLLVHQPPKKGKQG